MVTDIFPLLPPAGAVTTNVVVLADVTVAAKPLNLTVFPDAVALKMEPLMVTETPAKPDAGEIELITGAGTGLFFLQPDRLSRTVKIIKNE